MPLAMTLGQWQTQPIVISDDEDDNAREEASSVSKPIPNARKQNVIMEMKEEDEDEDEFAMASSLRSAKRARLTGKGGPRAAAVRMVNGTMTPITEPDAASPWSRTSAVDTAVQRQDSATCPSGVTTDSDDDSVASPVSLSRRAWREVSDGEVAQAQARSALVSLGGPAYPCWMYRGWQAPVQQSSEHRAVSTLQSAFRRASSPTKNECPEWTSFILDNFNIYYPPHSAHHAGELVTLDKLTQSRKAKFYLSGVLSFEYTKHFIQDVPFDVLTLEYGDTRAWQDRICVQSSIAAEQNVYYRLGSPAKEYERFYKPFLSIAQFTDYFIDFACERSSIAIADFRSDFWSWLQLSYGEDASFRTWHREIKMQDFRCLVAVNVEFLFKECYDIDQQSAGTADATRLHMHPLWAEVHPERLSAIPTQLYNPRARTVVTPFAYRAFQSMYFADMLELHSITDDGLKDRVAQRKRSLGLTPLHCLESEAKASTEGLIVRLRSTSDVCRGDVIVLDADRSGDWRLSTAELWYAYVQRVWLDRRGSRRIDVLWLYQPSDTTIDNAFYPYSNELFMSDNCDCGKDALYLDSINNVLGKVQVSWLVNDPSAETGLFVRRTFRTVPELNQYDFITLQDRHFCCHHQDDYIDVPPVTYEVGYTVLIRKTQDTAGRNCRPAVIVGFEDDGKVRLRKLAYASEVLPESRGRARPNELLLTNKECRRDKDAIVRRCYIRFFERSRILARAIPTPYDRDGAGDYFYIAVDQEGQDEDELTLRQGWDPRIPDQRPKLTGLGIFCGGGTFDRGLEEGGAVQFRYAVDLAEKALYSYRANDKHPEQTKYYYGSVNEYMATALSGKDSDVVAKPGTVRIIAGGFPCQSHSKMQRNKMSEQSLRNASMIGSVISFADVYAPEYLCLENVVNMTQRLDDGQNIFSQIIASLVGLGYQVQQFLMDAHCQGSSQARSRVFIIATAPACTVLEQPEYTHAAHHSQRKLGTCSNGRPFGVRRENAFVPFTQFSAEDAVRDLPDIQDGQTLLSAQYPDHRRATEDTATVRNRIAVVPKRPYGMTLVQAVRAGHVRGEARDYCQGRNQIKVGSGSKAYRRIFPNGLFPTVLTRLAVGDGMNGQVVHWNQDRVITIMEARRAQGYPDHEVLVGQPTDRLKIVGNSVDRKVALVLGLALRDSWLKSPHVSRSAGSSTNHDLAGSDNAFRSGLSATRLTMPNQDSDEIDEAPASQTTDSVVPSQGSSPVDNRTVKMSLNLSQEENASIRVGGFKRINELLEMRSLVQRDSR